MPIHRPPVQRSARSIQLEHALLRRNEPSRQRGLQVNTLAVDIGGTGIKMLVLNDRGEPITARLRELTPKPAKPESVLGLIARMAAQLPRFHRVSVGFPGIVVQGVIQSAQNLGNEVWVGYRLEAELQQQLAVPTRVINDADLQGYGVIEASGVELVLTLGTGVGAALFVDGNLVPNLELGHHPWRAGRTYEDRLSDSERHRVGKRRWSARVHAAIAQLEPVFNYRLLHIGGGNAEYIRGELPKRVRVFSNMAGLRGGIRLWQSPAT